jgi:hypothetical protein
MNVSPGYITRARADRLKKELDDGIDRIFDRIVERIAPRCADQPAKIVREILDEHARRAVKEIDALCAEFRARLYAPEH